MTGMHIFDKILLSCEARFGLFGFSAKLEKIAGLKKIAATRERNVFKQLIFWGLESRRLRFELDNFFARKISLLCYTGRF